MGALQASLFDLGVCPAPALDALSGSTCFNANMQQLAECCRRCHPTCNRVRVSAKGYAANCAMLLLHMPAARIMCAGGFVPSYCSNEKAEQPDEGDSLHYCLLLLATCTQRRPLDIHRTPAALDTGSTVQHKQVSTQAAFGLRLRTTHLVQQPLLQQLKNGDVHTSIRQDAQH